MKQRLNPSSKGTTKEGSEANDDEDESKRNRTYVISIISGILIIGYGTYVVYL